MSASWLSLTKKILVFGLHFHIPGIYADAFQGLMEERAKALAKKEEQEEKAYKGLTFQKINTIEQTFLLEPAVGLFSNKTRDEKYQPLLNDDHPGLVNYSSMNKRVKNQATHQQNAHLTVALLGDEKCCS